MEQPLPDSPQVTSRLGRPAALGSKPTSQPFPTAAAVGLHGRVARHKPRLLAVHKARRLDLAHCQHLTWTHNDWKWVLWSDVSCVSSSTSLTDVFTSHKWGGVLQKLCRYIVCVTCETRG